MIRYLIYTIIKSFEVSYFLIFLIEVNTCIQQGKLIDY